MKLSISTIRVRNFKAILDSGPVVLSPFTVFIGNNGAGKSSIVEALGLFQRLVSEDVDIALAPFRGLAHIRHKGAKPLWERQRSGDHLSVEVKGHNEGVAGIKPSPYRAVFEIGADPRGTAVKIAKEEIKYGTRPARSARNKPRSELVKKYLWPSAPRWQFLDLNARGIGQPFARRGAKVRITLESDGSNLTEYLLEMRNGAFGAEGRAAFNGFINALRQILPYASDLQPIERDFLQRMIHLELTEGTFKVPGWLLSTGTLRIACILAVLRHPQPPPLICIEEIENGLDPRTINLLISEIQYAVERGKTQVIATTHSPYLLDLVPLEMIVLAERVDGRPVFTRPADSKEVQAWAKRFSPGRLYTMNAIGQQDAGDRASRKNGGGASGGAVGGKGA